MNERYCLVIEPSNEPGVSYTLRRNGLAARTAWLRDGEVLDAWPEIRLTKEGAEQMALTVGGTIRKVVSPTE